MTSLMSAPRVLQCPPVRPIHSRCFSPLTPPGVLAPSLPPGSLVARAAGSQALSTVGFARAGSTRRRAKARRRILQSKLAGTELAPAWTPGCR